jgi:DNA-binding MarR family transcriptional regulator
MMAGIWKSGLEMNRATIHFKLADFRYALRCFLEFSEAAASMEGLSPQQHQSLLVIRASPAGTASIGHLAERLRIRHNSAVELANRLESAGLVIRKSSSEDRRSVILKLTADGEARLGILTRVHRNELKQLRPQIVGLLTSLEADAPNGLVVR